MVVELHVAGPPIRQLELQFAFVSVTQLDIFKSGDISRQGTLS